MSPKPTTIYICTNCDAQYAKWQGRCSECGAWGTVTEQAATIKTANKATANVAAATPSSLATIAASDAARQTTGVTEVDRVLGGGLVGGSLVLIGGDPGIGKSTLILQVAAHIPGALYVSGEESLAQIKIRAERLNIDAPTLQLLSETNIETIASTIEKIRPRLVIIDSIQTVSTTAVASAPGTVSQITASTALLLEAAKRLNIPIIIIGHVTKEGAIAGPKTLEHLVDVVLYLEHDNRNHYRILRGIKNRFGSIGEIGIFEMTATGFTEVADASHVFTSEQTNELAGTAQSLVIEGTRPYLVEIQALTSRTSFGYPQRRANGIDLNRLQLLIAVLMKTAKVDLSNQDVYLNVVGGLKIRDTATDLAICMAILSAHSGRAVPAKSIYIGEIGLSGELRAVSQLDRRVQEAQRLGIKTIVIPKTKTALKGAVELATLTDIGSWFISATKSVVK